MNKPYGIIFEELVRQVAEALWRLEPGTIQPEWYYNDPILSELDGIARLPEITHLLMVTTSTKLTKIQEDVEKLTKAERKERPRGVPCKMWLITEQQLNAEHISFARKKSVEVISYGQFCHRFFNGYDYIAKRRNAPFGSSRNLRDGSIRVPDDEYVELPMNTLAFAAPPSVAISRESTCDIPGIVRLLHEGRRVCLVGPFGAGKSLSAREVFFELCKMQRINSAEPVPVFLNLREHWGAMYGDEILERHGRSIGFVPKESLTVAWRAGVIHLVLDGFDEVATQAIVKPGDRSFMRRTRFEALQAVRDLVTKAPPHVGILICGRDHYFDSDDELRRALGLTNQSFVKVHLGEFTEASARQFLKRHANSQALPDWLPRKPLLLGYLAHQKLLDRVLAIDADRGFGYAWNSFLDLVCNREAEHDRAVMDPLTIRHVLERLACMARSTPAGNGPITSLDLAEAYRAETGEIPGEGVLMQLQRLPGLTPREQDPTARSFVDPDLLSALQGGAVARVLVDTGLDLGGRAWRAALSRDGVRMAAYLLEQQGMSAAAILDVIRRIERDSVGRPEMRQMLTDLFVVAVELTDVKQPINGRGLLLSDGSIETLDLEERAVRDVIFRNSSIEQLFVGEGFGHSNCKFEGCVISKLSGVSTAAGLPSSQFSNCDFGEFDEASTNAAILRLDIPPSLKALMTVLRKLYLQAGGGRQLEALKRGMPGGGPVYLSVDWVLKELEAEGMVSVTGNVAHPIRRHTSRARQILAEGVLSKDPLVDRLRKRG